MNPAAILTQLGDKATSGKATNQGTAGRCRAAVSPLADERRKVVWRSVCIMAIERIRLSCRDTRLFWPRGCAGVVALKAY